VLFIVVCELRTMAVTAEQQQQQQQFRSLVDCSGLLYLLLAWEGSMNTSYSISGCMHSKKLYRSHRYILIFVTRT
jgi:hypothetical protein